MEEYMSTLPLIIHGCKLAKELESSCLENKTASPLNIEDVANRCDQIAKIFGNSSKRLRTRAENHCNDNNNKNYDNIDPTSNEWLGTGAIKGVDMINNQSAVLTQGMAKGLMVSARTACSSSQRQRRRRASSECRIVKMAAPQIGNTEIPPDDGFTWRKYGQKEIMGKKYPRGYFRCTHQRQFKCPAKKQVQRDELEPNMFEVVYRGNHTCHLSATAPSMLPPQAIILSSDNRPTVTSTSTVTSSIPLGNWLSMEFGTMSSNTDFASSSRYGKELNVLEFPVVDMADEMFNSGPNSTSNNIDFLFPVSAEEHKRELGDK